MFHRLRCVCVLFQANCSHSLGISGVIGCVWINMPTTVNASLLTNRGCIFFSCTIVVGWLEYEYHCSIEAGPDHRMAGERRRLAGLKSVRMIHV